MNSEAQNHRQRIRENLSTIIARLNEVLSGSGVDNLEMVLERIGRGGRLPHWYVQLKQDGSLPNLDGKTIGSVIEMLFVAVLETMEIDGKKFPAQRINPARGVDLPDLQLGIKSPSENFCTSEPFFSAYERLLGSEFDVVVLLTDYQQAKKAPPLRLQIIKYSYLSGSQIADRGLCEIARTNREWLLHDNPDHAARLFKFLAYSNQSDWLARKLLTLAKVLGNDDAIRREISLALSDFKRSNRRLEANDKPLIPDADLSQLEKILAVTPLFIGVIDALDNWVSRSLRDAARSPNENEFERLRNGPLDGQIGMSFALQWRFNFSSLFGEREVEGEVSVDSDE